MPWEKNSLLGATTHTLEKGGRGQGEGQVSACLLGACLPWPEPLRSCYLFFLGTGGGRRLPPFPVSLPSCLCHAVLVLVFYHASELPRCHSMPWTHLVPFLWVEHCLNSLVPACILTRYAFPSPPPPATCLLVSSSLLRFASFIWNSYACNTFLIWTMWFTSYFPDIPHTRAVRSHTHLSPFLRPYLAAC